MRLLFIVVLLVVSFLILKSIRNKIDQNSNNLSKSTKSGNVLKCQHCGLHVPEQEAIRQGDKVFCSLEHARQQLE